MKHNDKHEHNKEPTYDVNGLMQYNNLDKGTQSEEQSRGIPDGPENQEPIVEDMNARVGPEVKRY